MEYIDFIESSISAKADERGNLPIGWQEFKLSIAKSNLVCPFIILYIGAHKCLGIWLSRKN